MSNDALKREIQRLRRKVYDRDFRAGAPALDQDGLPCWGGTPGLSVESYSRLLGDSPDAQLTASELETRERLSPYSEVFETLQRDEEEGEDVR